MDIKKYYTEEVFKDTKYRADYIESIDAFLQAARTHAAKQREQFITPEKYAKDTAGYRAKFIQMLGFPLTEKREPAQIIEKTFVARDNNVDIYRLQFVLPFGIKFYGMYFQQIEGAETAPFVFGFHGGWGTPELVSSVYMDSSNYNHLVRRMTDRGANVFAPQFVLWNVENFGNAYDRDLLDGKLRQIGGSITAFELYCLECIVDYFEQSGQVNMQRFGVAGLSYGGMYALHLAAVDTRVKACYSCSWVCDGYAWSKGDWSYWNAQKTFTVAETIALVCPRPFVAAMGDKDPLFSHVLTTAEMQKAQAYYQAFDKPEYIQCVVFDGDHETDKGDEELDFLFAHL